MIKKSTKTTIRLPKNRPPIHPGQILSEEYMLPYDLTQQETAAYLKISRKHLIDIIHAAKPISLEIAHRLAKLFQTSIDFWIQGQLAYDVWHTIQNPSRKVRAIKPLKVNVN